MPSTDRLVEYRKKRDFRKTPEPKGKAPSSPKTAPLIFVVQEHHASHLHYDFRLEWEGVLKSWAVPKAPSLDPQDRRLAIQVEDHPLAYAKFTGTIPPHSYGAGRVARWDHGTWLPLNDPTEGFRDGHLQFVLKGKKLRGRFSLIRTHKIENQPHWLLIKYNDQYALRADKPPEEFTIKKPKAAPSPNAGRFSSPEKIIFPDEGITKAGVAAYYQKVSGWLLAHLINRPLTLLRCPEGAAKPCFYSKHLSPELPAGVRAVADPMGAPASPFFMIDSEEGLLSLVQMDAIETHPWNCRASDLETPDQIVIDFDPGPGVNFALVKEAALEMKGLLEQIGLRPFLKCTGGKGLHVQFPIEPLYSWEQIKNFAHTLSEEMVSRQPKLFTSRFSKTERPKRILVDYLRNYRGSTAIAPYSLRARTTSAVAIPLAWSELDALPGANFYTLDRTLKFLETRHEDPWREYFETRQKIPILRAMR